MDPFELLISLRKSFLPILFSILVDGCQELKIFCLLLFVKPFVMDYFRWNSVNWLDQFVLRLLDIGGGGGRALHLGRRLLRPHHHLRGHDVTSGHLGSQQGCLEKILGSIEGEICTLLLISDFYLRWRNPSVTISDQSVRRVTANHLCHECHAELITRDTPSLWSVIVTSLWHHWQSSHENCSSSTPVLRLLSLSILVTPLFWLHSNVHSHWLQFSQTLDSV